MTITATIAGAISMLAQFGMFFGGHRDSNSGPGIIGSIAMMILAPFGAMSVQTAISRTREYAADNLGTRIVGQPMCSCPRWSRSPTPRTKFRRWRLNAIRRRRTCLVPIPKIPAQAIGINL
jgi:Peptidase family M48